MRLIAWIWETRRRDGLACIMRVLSGFVPLLQNYPHHQKKKTICTTGFPPSNDHTKMILRPLFIYRTYATVAKRPSRLGKTVDLDHVRALPDCAFWTTPPFLCLTATNFTLTLQFLQRNKAIALWRSIVRGCKRIEDPNTRKDTLKFARDEFQRNRNVEDIVCHFPLLNSTDGLEGRQIANGYEIVTNSILDINRQDGVGDNGEVYRWIMTHIYHHSFHQRVTVMPNMPLRISFPERLPMLALLCICTSLFSQCSMLETIPHPAPCHKSKQFIIDSSISPVVAYALDSANI